MARLAHNAPATHGTVMYPRVGGNKARVHGGHHVHGALAEELFHFKRKRRKPTVETHCNRGIGLGVKELILDFFELFLKNCQGFFHKNVLARPQGFEREAGVLVVAGGYQHQIYFGVV